MLGGQGETRTLVPSWWVVQILGKQLAVPQETKHRVTITPSNPSLRHMPKRDENTCPKRNLHTNVHGSISHYSQKVETSEISINK